MFLEERGDAVFYVVRVAPVTATTLAPDKKGEETVPPPHEGRTEINSKFTNAWLFQSNPALYKLRKALQSLEEQVWTVSRYAKEIRTGDRVYLWEAGRQGGIAGLAEVIEPPRLQSEPPEQLPFARVDEAFAGDRIRTRLRILRVIKPLVARQTIVACPELVTLGVLRCSRGTNFRVSREEAKALDGLIIP